MEVAKIQVGGTCACAYEKKTIRAGMVGVTVSFAFDEYWDGLNKIAVYRCGGVVRDEYLEGDTGTIPAEVLTKSGFDLEVGVYGTDAEKQIAIPTCWADLGVVRPGADPSGDPAADPSLPIWAQILAKLGNLADLNTEAKENLVAAINEALTKGGGEVDPEEIGRIVDEYLKKNPPAAYTLPLATETTLGGVKAAAATEEMTQPVGITAEGKLVTVPCQDSGGNVDQSGGLTTAQIEALHGMFKVCAYDDSKDVSGAYAAFKTAFGITDESGGEEEPDTPVTPDEPEKTLSSISATYSGGDVAVGTAVTALTGIMVTARYSDGTSETVTGYTLSGTIAEGSNTVTVSYGDKTATFTVTGVAESGGGDAGEAKTLSMTLHNASTFNSLFYTGDADSEQLTAWNGWWYKSDAVADRDSVVNIAFTANTVNTGLIYYAAQIKQEDFKKFYYVEQLGTAMTTETIKSCTVRAGYELVFIVSNSSEIASLNVTYTDGAFTDVPELYTNRVSGYRLDTRLVGNTGAVTENFTGQITTDPVDISDLDKVYVVCKQNGVIAYLDVTYCFYDSNNTFISGGDAPKTASAITVPDNAKYIRTGSSNTRLAWVYVGENAVPYLNEFVHCV